MKVRLVYHAQIRQAAGVEGETVEVAAGTTVALALAETTRRRDESFRVLILSDDGSLRPSLLVLVNSVPAPHGTPRVLNEGDEVAIFSPVAGG